VSGKEAAVLAIHISSALYAAAVALWLLRERPGFARIARACWAAACGLFVTHVALAFHFYHGWSHADALKETARRAAEATGSSTGNGIYLNYLMILIWSADAVWWLLRPAAYESRPRAIEGVVHAFLAFMFFNAVVVFGSGWLSGAGIAATAVLAMLLAWRLFGPTPTA
jgi:hypothetical protein